MARNKRSTRPSSIPDIQNTYHLTPKQAAYVHGKLLSPTDSETALVRAAGYSDPNGNSPKIRRIPAVQDAISDLFARHGMTKDVLIEKAWELLSAQKNGEPDGAVQARVLEMMLRCQKMLDTNTTTNVNVGVRTSDTSALSEATSALARYQQALTEARVRGVGGGEGGSSV